MTRTFAALTALALAACARGNAPQPQAAAFPTAVPVRAVVLPSPRTGVRPASEAEVVRLRADLARLRRERDDALARLGGALWRERVLQARLAALTHNPGQAAADGGSGEVFSSVSTAP